MFWLTYYNLKKEEVEGGGERMNIKVCNEEPTHQSSLKGACQKLIKFSR